MVGVILVCFWSASVCGDNELHKHEYQSKIDIILLLKKFHSMSPTADASEVAMLRDKDWTCRRSVLENPQ